MKRFVAILTAACLMLCLGGCKTQKTKYTDYSFDYFDTATSIVGYESSKEDFDAVCGEIKSLLAEYHQLYNIYNRYDGINNLCTVNDLENGAHNIVAVDAKIIELLQFAKEVYTLTDGRTNVAMGSVLSIWHQYRTDGINHPESAELPPMDKLKAAAEHTDIDNVVIDTDNNTVYLADPEMSLDVGAVAKGYAVERVAEYLEQKGITGYILNVGGNVRCVGSRPDGEPWTIGIENPDTENADEPYVSYLQLTDKCLVTSGSYQRYYTVNGQRYHHIIDPDTLMPSTDFQSVSVLCDDSGLADALSTALFTMSYEDGLTLIEKTDGVEAMWILQDGEKCCSSHFGDYEFEYK